MTQPDENATESTDSTKRRTFLGATGSVGAFALMGIGGGTAAAKSDEAESENGRGSDEKSDRAVEVHEGITYAERDAGELKLDLFVPEVDDPPLVVYFHGGGWVFETRDNIPEPKRYAEEWGYAIASVSYRLSEIPEDVEIPFVDPDNPTPRGVFPDHFVDAKASIRWLRANADEYGYDADRVAAWGSSAGGHLALLTGFVDDVTDLAGETYSEDELTKEVAPEESGSVQAVVDWYGVSDLTLMPGEEGDTESLLIGGPKADNEAKYEQASPTTHVSSDSPPTLIMHGRADQILPIEQSRVLYDALDEAGVDSVLYELHDLNHVFAHGGLEEIQSERVAMDLLAADETPAQSIYEATHIGNGETAKPLIEAHPPAGPNATTPPAGPKAIGRFLDRTISSHER